METLLSCFTMILTFLISLLTRESTLSHESTKIEKDDIVVAYFLTAAAIFYLDKEATVTFYAVFFEQFS